MATEIRTTVFVRSVLCGAVRADMADSGAGDSAHYAVGLAKAFVIVGRGVAFITECCRCPGSIGRPAVGICE
ncbi:hypothetical protein [Methyloversatilis sp.]|uniref:hypothetical protein n=1 Tax=Methyloversatilis sp. TaxID=2569862 RepID=UPI003D2C979A